MRKRKGFGTTIRRCSAGRARKIVDMEKFSRQLEELTHKLPFCDFNPCRVIPLPNYRVGYPLSQRQPYSILAYWMMQQLRLIIDLTTAKLPCILTYEGNLRSDNDTSTMEPVKNMVIACDQRTDIRRATLWSAC